MSPKSVKRTSESSEQVPLIVFHSVLVKKLEKLFFKSPFPVMLFLSFDVISDAFHLGCADAEGAITVLPRELPILVELVVNPF